MYTELEPVNKIMQIFRKYNKYHEVTFLNIPSNTNLVSFCIGQKCQNCVAADICNGKPYLDENGMAELSKYFPEYFI